jgi:hypothetical protein
MAPMQIVELAGFRLPRADLQSGRRRCPPFLPCRSTALKAKRTPHELSSYLQSSTNAGNISIYRKLLDDVAIDDMQTAGRVPSDKRDAVCVGLELEIDASHNARP